MKQFKANSNYNVTIYANSIKEATKLYKNFVLTSLFWNEKESLNSTQIEETLCEQIPNLIEKECIFTTSEKYFYLNDKKIKLEYVLNLLLSASKQS